MQSVAIADDEGFRQIVERHRPELQLHCYRMLGSLQDAEDLVQETLLRAWRARGSYGGRASPRTWLYRIATNACLDVLRQRPKRQLPAGYGNPADPRLPGAPPRTEMSWLEPYPDSLLDLVDQDSAPDARYDARESVELAFLAAIQRLSPRARAVLLARDVLDWSAAETAELLEITVTSVNSALQRARAAMRKQLPSGAESFSAGAGAREIQRQVAEQYRQAWEAADSQRLTALLKEDVTLSMPPVPSWYLGRSAVVEFLIRNPMSPEWQGRLRLHPTWANRRPAFAVYHRDEDSNVSLPFGLMTLRVDGGMIAEILGFVDPRLFRFFDVPKILQD